MTQTLVVRETAPERFSVRLEDEVGQVLEEFSELTTGEIIELSYRQGYLIRTAVQWPAGYGREWRDGVPDGQAD